MEKNPDAPKKPHSAQFLFKGENIESITAKLKKEHGEAFTQTMVSKEVNKEWEKVSEKKKKEQQEMADKLINKYKVEKEKYDAKQKESQKKKATRQDKHNSTSGKKSKNNK